MCGRWSIATTAFVGMAQLRQVLDLADDGAESPQETRLRLLLTSAGMRPSHTQIEVFDHGHRVGRIDMGWPEWKVGVQYDGIQHWTDPTQRTRDIEQNAEYEGLGWRMVHVAPTCCGTARARSSPAPATRCMPRALPTTDALAKVGLCARFSGNVAHKPTLDAEAKRVRVG